MKRRGPGRVIAGFAAAWVAAFVDGGSRAADLRLLVMDPLARELACACVAGYAQRDYPRLAKFLERELGGTIDVAFAEALGAREAGDSAAIDLVAGRFTTVRSDARKAGVSVRPIAMLSGADGELTVQGLFVVRGSDGAASVADLAGRRILFGPEDAEEKRAAALAAFEAFGVRVPAEILSAGGCSSAAGAVVDGDADAAVISSYAMPLLMGCGSIKKGELKVIGRTDPVPFIGVFATARFPEARDEALRAALAKVAADQRLLAALESRDGFVGLSGISAAAWDDWRGPGRAAASADIPSTLPARPRFLWKRTLTGPGMSGLSVAGGRVLVADKGDAEKTDLFRCLDCDTGRELWKCAYPAEGEMDFTNSPRATPVVHKGLVYLLGAFGELRCVKLETGETVWRRNIVADFCAERPMWGTCATPLVEGERLIVNPGAAEASLAALNLRTGEVLWKTPGERAAYASFIAGMFGGVLQIVGYDGISLGGWDPETGRRLWRLVPEEEGDFNVPTPVALGENLLISTENNGTRLYGFDAGGRIRPEPLARNAQLRPDTSTPVVCGGLVFGHSGGLYCLDPQRDLETAWAESDDPALADYCSLLAGGDRVLVTAMRGKLVLIEAARTGFRPVASLELFPDVPDAEREVWSHPAVVDGRFYVRNFLEVACLLLGK